jgi:tetratricopeptide (TPR) repeat protein
VIPSARVRQLSLFPDSAPELPPSEPEPSAWPPPPELLPGQLHLFSDRSILLGSARAAIADARLDDARRALLALTKRFPKDGFIAREAACTAAVRKRLTAAVAAPPDERAKALLALARSLDGQAEPWAKLRVAVLCRVADELSGAQGDAAILEGQPPGFYLLEAGALEEARASLTRTLDAGPGARALFLLADTTLLLGARAAARRRYLEALLLDPFDAAFAGIRDEDVRALPTVAGDEIEIAEEPLAWSAPVGIVTAVLPWPAGLSQRALAPDQPAAGAASSPSRRDAIERARAFVRAIAEMGAPEGRGRTVELRRTMKQLCPRLFEVYMDRVVRGNRA